MNFLYCIIFLLAIIVASCSEDSIDKSYSGNVEYVSKIMMPIIISIDKFKKSESRLPKNLMELVDKKLIKMLPSLDERIFFSFEDNNGVRYSYKVLGMGDKEYFTITTMLVGGLSSDIDIYYFPRENENRKLLPVDSEEVWGRYKHTIRFNDNWVYCY